MTTLQLYDKFLNLLNKYGDPSVEDIEFNDWYNTAQLAELKDQTLSIHSGHPDTLQYAFELTQQMMERWYPIIKTPAAPIVVPASGLLTWDAIETALTENNVKPKVYHLANVMTDGDVEIHFVRHNDLTRRLRNVFLKPKTSRPIYTGLSDGIQIRPKEVVSVVPTVLIYPPDIKLDLDNTSNNVNPILPDATLIDILFRMLSYAGVNIREQQFYEMVNKEHVKQ